MMKGNKEEEEEKPVNSPQIEYFDAQIVHRILYYGRCNLQQLRDVRLAIKFLLSFFHQYPTCGCDHAAA